MFSKTIVKDGMAISDNDLGNALYCECGKELIVEEHDDDCCYNVKCSCGKKYVVYPLTWGIDEYTKEMQEADIKRGEPLAF